MEEIEYELAKQLMEAGYPQDGFDGHRPGILLDRVYYPTLYELIKACGEDFVTLGRYAHVNPATELRFYVDGKLTKSKLQRYLGSTPSEALARLWLELNKK